MSLKFYLSREVAVQWMDDYTLTVSFIHLINIIECIPQQIDHLILCFDF